MQLFTDEHDRHRIIKIMRCQAGVYLPRPVQSSPELIIHAKSGTCSGRINCQDKLVLAEYRYAVRCPQNNRCEVASWICRANQAQGSVWGCLNLDFSDGTIWHRTCLPRCAVGLDDGDLAAILCAGIRVFDAASTELLQAMLQTGQERQAPRVSRQTP